MEHFLIDGSYAKLLAACRIDAAEVLRRAQLPGDLLARKAIRLTEAEYYRFLAAIGESSEEKDLAVRMATSEQIKTFFPPIFAAYCSKDGRTCIARLAAYKRLIGPMRYAIEETADACTVTLRPGDAALTIPAFLAEAEAAFLIALLRAATKEPIRPLRLTLATPPQSPALAELAGIPVSHAAENSITFAARDLARPFLSHDDAMWSYFEPELTRRLADLAVDDTTAARVASALAELLPGGAATIEAVAAKLGLSRRTLQRKLSEEQTTFQKQLSRTRETLARHYLCHTDFTVGDIAFLLGYQETNSFLRAFVLWTGETPAACRRRGRNA